MTLSQKKNGSHAASGSFEKFVAVTCGNTDSMLHEKIMTVDIDKAKDNFSKSKQVGQNSALRPFIGRKDSGAIE